jgi:NAD(P)-dependent dehydrogenase (short-subunit alcohol dehydrogenase family)
MPRRVLVTAAAGGIGLAIARAFAAEGDRVHICDIDAPALARATAGHDAITGSVCDVSDRAAVAAWVAEAAQTLGGIDVLVNNAGVPGPTAAVQDMAPDAWEAVLAVNLTGTFDVTRHAIPHLKRSGDGVILIMSSLAGRFGYENRSPYATAKRGLLGFAETLALELGGDGVRVNAIAPGAVLGERMQAVLRGRQEATGKSMEQLTEEALANQALKRFVDPDDIAALAVFLASDRARSITGQTIAIDGGSKAAQ